MWAYTKASVFNYPDRVVLKFTKKQTTDTKEEEEEGEWNPPDEVHRLLARLVLTTSVLFPTPTETESTAS